MYKVYALGRTYTCRTLQEVSEVLGEILAKCPYDIVHVSKT